MTRGGNYYIIYWAIGVHLAWGIVLVTDDPAILPVTILIGLQWILDLHIGGQLLGLILLSAALSAAFGLALDHRISSRVSLLLLMPQYALLIAAFVSDLTSIFSGSIEGRAVDQLLLFIALCPVMLAALLHSAAIVERHLTWTQKY